MEWICGNLSMSDVFFFFVVCSSSAVSVWRQCFASAQWGARDGGAAQPGSAPWHHGQYLVDGCTQEETHHWGQPHKEEIWDQTPKTQGMLYDTIILLSSCLTMFISLFLTFTLFPRLTLSHVQSVAIWSRSMSCADSAMIKFARKLPWFVIKWKQWRVDLWVPRL